MVCCWEASMDTPQYSCYCCCCSYEYGNYIYTYICGCDGFEFDFDFDGSAVVFVEALKWIIRIRSIRR